MGKSEATDRPPQILLIGDDPTLQYSRRLVLEAAGYRVRSAKSNVVVEESSLRGVEVALLCHTIREEEETRLVRAFAQLAPQMIVLQISRLDEPLAARGRAGAVSARPTALLGAVAARIAQL